MVRAAGDQTEGDRVGWGGVCVEVCVCGGGGGGGGWGLLG